MSSNAAPSSRMTHRADAGQIDFPHEKLAKWVGACGVEFAPLIEVALNQGCAPHHSLVEEQGVACVDSIGTDGNDDVSVAGEDFLLVFISNVARNRRSRWSTRPLKKGKAVLITRGVITMEKYHQRERTARQVLGIVDHRAKLCRLVRESEGIVAVIVFGSSNREGTWIAGILSMRRAGKKQEQRRKRLSESLSLGNHPPPPGAEEVSLVLSSVPKSRCLSPSPLPY